MRKEMRRERMQDEVFNRIGDNELVGEMKQGGRHLLFMKGQSHTYRTEKNIAFTVGPITLGGDSYSRDHWKATHHLRTRS